MKPDSRWTACIFDFDGVLIDSEPLHAEAKRVTLNHFQIPHADELLTSFKGRPDSAFFRHVEAELTGGRAAAREMEAFKVATYLDLFHEVPLVPGALDFLATARGAFPKLGLATSATRHDFELGAEKYELTKWFDAIVTGDDTVKHKPDPEPYVKALAALSVISSDALVIEDSPNGIYAAKAAHCNVVGLTTNFQPKELRDAGADVVAASYSELLQILGIGRHRANYL